MSRGRPIARAPRPDSVAPGPCRDAAGTPRPPARQLVADRGPRSGSSAPCRTRSVGSLPASSLLLAPPEEPRDAGRERQEHERGDRVAIDDGGDRTRHDDDNDRHSHSRWQDSEGIGRWAIGPWSIGPGRPKSTSVPESMRAGAPGVLAGLMPAAAASSTAGAAAYSSHGLSPEPGEAAIGVPDHERRGPGAAGEDLRGGGEDGGDLGLSAGRAPAPVLALLLAAGGAGHWITSSARSKSDGGIVRPRALAVLRLSESVKRVGRSIGISAGGVRARILTAIVPA
jgi:hypothetical protein